MKRRDFMRLGLAGAGLITLNATHALSLCNKHDLWLAMVEL